MMDITTIQIDVADLVPLILIVISAQAGNLCTNYLIKLFRS